MMVMDDYQLVHFGDSTAVCLPYLELLIRGSSHAVDRSMPKYISTRANAPRSGL